MKCPGQDWRYWTADAVFDVPCPQCGATVELFKDDGTGHCRHCGHRFANPGLNMGCAEWCSMANECLGFTPERTSPGAGLEKAFAALVIQAIQQEFKTDQARLAHALRAFQYAKELLRSEGGDPRVALAAVLLLGTATAGPTPAHRAGEILQQIGVDAPTSERICRIIESIATGHDLDAAEFRVVCDGNILAKLGAGGRCKDMGHPQPFSLAALQTVAGRDKALSLLEDK